jgi:transposase
MAWRKLTDEQWEFIEPFIPKRPKSPKDGRPPADDRKCLEGILWVLWTGDPWMYLPKRYGRYTTC